jgi:ribosomal protein S19E (S16A)
VLERTIAGLVQDQPTRRHIDPEGAQQIDEYVDKIKSTMALNQTFHVVSYS